MQYRSKLERLEPAGLPLLQLLSLSNESGCSCNKGRPTSSRRSGFDRYGFKLLFSTTVTLHRSTGRPTGVRGSTERVTGYRWLTGWLAADDRFAGCADWLAAGSWNGWPADYRTQTDRLAQRMQKIGQTSAGCGYIMIWRAQQQRSRSTNGSCKIKLRLIVLWWKHTGTTQCDTTLRDTM